MTARKGTKAWHSQVHEVKRKSRRPLTREEEKEIEAEFLNSIDPEHRNDYLETELERHGDHDDN